MLPVQSMEPTSGSIRVAARIVARGAGRRHADHDVSGRIRRRPSQLETALQCVRLAISERTLIFSSSGAESREYRPWRKHADSTGRVVRSLIGPSSELIWRSWGAGVRCAIFDYAERPLFITIPADRGSTERSSERTMGEPELFHRC